MPFVQRNTEGAIVGVFANCQPIFAEEYLSEGNPELTEVSADQTAIDERAWRNATLVKQSWLRDRHRDQLEIGATTTLSADQYNELLVHMQALRDWPQSEVFPDAAMRPQAPQFLEQYGGV